MVWLRRSCFPAALVVVAGCSSTSVTQVSAQSDGGLSSSGGDTSAGGRTRHTGGATLGPEATGGTSGLGGTSNAAGNTFFTGGASQAGAESGGVVATGGRAAIGGAAGGGTKATGGFVATGGTGTGGASAGGGMKATGGVGATGGAATAGGTAGGGAANGGTKATGGNPATGGRATGGAATGGAVTGGAATGGRATGGAATGGAATGGRATGGAATGGVATGGAATGGAATGGAGTGGTTSTWCQNRQMPTNVTAADYQCIDFDTGMPPTATWAQSLTNSGTMALTTDRESSPPNSLDTSVPAATGDYTTAGSATLSWHDVGATPISTISVASGFSPTAPGGVYPAWTGSVALMCVAFGSGQACLNYTYKSTSLSFQTTAYTGYYIAWVYGGSAAARGDCALTDGPPATVWTRVELQVAAATGTITVNLAGITIGSCAGLFGADTTSTITVGSKANINTTFAFEMFYDNVVAYVARQ